MQGKENKERLKAESQQEGCRFVGVRAGLGLSRGDEKNGVFGNEWKNQHDLVINWILGWGKQTRKFSATGRIKRRKRQF